MEIVLIRQNNSRVLITCNEQYFPELSKEKQRHVLCIKCEVKDGAMIAFERMKDLVEQND